MNKKEVLIQINEISGVNMDSCGKVIKALEQVFQQELSNSKKKDGIFNIAFKAMSFINNSRHKN